MRGRPPEVELILQKTWTGESDFFPWLLLRNWHYLASGWQVHMNERLQVKLAVMSYGVLSCTSLILLKLHHESGPLGMANWMNVDVYEVLLAGKSVTCISLRSVSGILSCSCFFIFLASVLVSGYKTANPSHLHGVVSCRRWSFSFSQAWAVGCPWNLCDCPNGLLWS